MRAFTRVFGSRNERLLHEMMPILDRVNALEPGMRRLTDAELRAKTDEFRKRLADGQRLDDLLPEAFAVAREAGRRVVKTPDLENPRPMRHFDVQLIGGIVLHQGKIAEMVTGEGKTLVATLPAYLNALPGKGVHIVTVNDYLARRDRDWMGPLYEFLGLTAGAIQAQQPYDEKRAAYQCDITFGTNSEFGFDYLRDNMAPALEAQVQQRGLNYAIVDEVDNILIDEARTPLIISGPAEESTEKYYRADRLSKALKKGKHFELKEKEHAAHLTEEGISEVERQLGVDSIYTPKNMDWPHHIEQSLRAHNLYKRDVDYVVKGGEIVIVDEFTGRLMEGRRWSDGLHQAVEAKERLRIREENQTLATITLQNFFRMYKKLAGMTGTALTEAAEFDKIYKLDVVVIPTNLPLIRLSNPDVVFRTEKEKWDAIEEEIVQVNETGRPMLVGTVSIEKSEMLSERLRRRGIEHEVLNAKQHAREAQIVALAGQHGRVTVATNMAGRGTDIVLGEGVAELGGLHIVGTERHEARRIDNQLRGRAGRQGDPGSSRFFLSLEDDLMRVFASERVSSLLKRFGMEDGVAIEHGMVTRSIERAQRKVEEHNFDIRKHLLEYDEVMDEQRKTIYTWRQNVLEGKDLKESVLRMIEESVEEALDTYLPPKVPTSEWDVQGLQNWFSQKTGRPLTLPEAAKQSPEEIEGLVINEAEAVYEAREKELSEPIQRRIEQFLLLSTIDAKWKDHLYAMDHLKSGIGLRGYGQVDPKVEYKREALNMFETMASSIREEITDIVFKVKMASPEDAQDRKSVWNVPQMAHQEMVSFRQQQEAAAASSQQAPEKLEPIRVQPKVGRNQRCPCGSGKKYKQCCGR
ncbi:MAG: preprotein translocase subunit SecA [Planctomycetes bacterium]|nr:preprotein translocase subunit SecA [Planctomycetota bacterium]